MSSICKRCFQPMPKGRIGFEQLCPDCIKTMKEVEKWPKWFKEFSKGIVRYHRDTGMFS